ncbi:MAG TPA: hypothetical protein VLB09_08510 [Nitrospiria bacterium]|nr:hypothetical protein [Nitrospiria bacterium]
MIKLIRWTIIIGLAFGAGFLLGTQREEKVQKILSSVRQETSARVSGLEGEVRSLRFKVHLTSAKDRIVSARENILERNFGRAEEKLTGAGEELQKAAAMTSKKAAGRLNGIRKEIDPLLPRLKRSDPGVSKKLNELEQELEDLIEELD